jgi:hypothetical protein
MRMENERGIGRNWATEGNRRGGKNGGSVAIPPAGDKPISMRKKRGKTAARATAFPQTGFCAETEVENGRVVRSGFPLDRLQSHHFKSLAVFLTHKRLRFGAVLCLQFGGVPLEFLAGAKGNDPQQYRFGQLAGVIKIASRG